MLVLAVALAGFGCANVQSKQPDPQPLPVKTKDIHLAPVPRTDEYVAIVKSRRSANIQPQVDGALTSILVKSGDHVRAGQLLMTIDPLKQQAVVDQQRSTEAQKKAILDYNQIDLERQKKLYEEAVASKQAYDLAVQAYENSKADWESAKSATATQERELSYYSLTAPFDGIVGDIPVHVGDYVSPQTLLTTVDENAELEAYIYIPTERSANIRMGLPVQIVTNAGELIESTKIYFISEQVDNATQGILVKAPIHASLDKFRDVATCEGAGGVEHGANADGSRSGDHAHWWTAVCVCGGGGEQWHGRQTASGYTGRYHWKRLRGDRRPEAWG